MVKYNQDALYLFINSQVMNLKREMWCNQNVFYICTKLSKRNLIKFKKSVAP